MNKEMILLGAGTSKEAGVPPAYEMTKEIIRLFNDRNVLKSRPDLSKYNQVILFAVGGLLFQQGIKGENPLNGVNIEELFSAIQLLANRQNIEAASFISAWHPLVETLDRTSISAKSREQAKSDIERILINLSGRSNNSNRSPFPTSSILADFGFSSNSYQRVNVQELAEAVEIISSSFVERPSQGEIFRRTNELMLQKLIQLVWIEDDEKVDYLEPLLQTKNTIVSLNYDNAIELAARKFNRSITTGIEYWSEKGQFPQDLSEILLLKLHGSIDWAFVDRPCSGQRPIPYQIIAKVSSEHFKESNFSPAIIFGQRNKLTAKGPFLELLRAFERELSQSKRLTTIGYSYRDEHINEYIFQWLNKNPQNQLRVINGKNFTVEHLPLPAQTIEFLKSRVETIAMYASEGIAYYFL